MSPAPKAEGILMATSNVNGRTKRTISAVTMCINRADFYSKLKEAREDPKSFNTIQIAGQVFDFTDPYAQILNVPMVKKHVRDNRLEVVVQLVRLID